MALSHTKRSNNRSVMPLDVRGRTCATMAASARVSPERARKPLNRSPGWDWGLQVSPMNTEFLVGASHQLASIESLPFVHTARRYYRSLRLMSPSDWTRWGASVPRVMVYAEKMGELSGVEEVKVVTRYP